MISFISSGFRFPSPTSISDLGIAFQIADDWLDTYGDPKVFGKAIGGDILNNKKSWLMTRAFEKASEETRATLLEAMAMPIDTDQEKEAKIATVKAIYAELEVGEEAKQEIVRFHSKSLSHAVALNLHPEAYGLLENYAKKLIGRTK